MNQHINIYTRSILGRDGGYQSTKVAFMWLAGEENDGRIRTQMTFLKPDVADVLKKFESIKNQANRLRQSLRDSLFGPIEEVKSLVEEYKDAKAQFGKIRYEHNLDTYLRDIEIKGTDYSAVYEQKALLREIDVECEKAIGALESLATPLSEEDLAKLMALRERMKTLAEVLPDINFEINLNEALNEYEKGDYLASALISSRVTLYVVNQIQQKFAGKTLKISPEKGYSEGDRKVMYESILNATKRASEFFSYDITIFPTSSDALSLAADAIEVLEIVGNLLTGEEIKSWRSKSNYPRAV